MGGWVGRRVNEVKRYRGSAVIDVFLALEFAPLPQSLTFCLSVRSRGRAGGEELLL